MFDTTSEATSPLERVLIVFFRLNIGWMFLWAGIHHFGDAKFVTGFLSHTKTFHDFFVVFTAPSVAPVVGFLVAYGHLLIGLSLLFGLMVRVSATLKPWAWVPPSLLLMLLAKERSVSLYPSWYCIATSQKKFSASSVFLTWTTAETGVLPVIR